MKLNKKASMFDIASQSIFWIPRIFFLIVFILVVLTPIGCYSKNKINLLEKVEENQINLIINEIKTCVENGFSELEVNNCIKNKKVGFVVSSDDTSFVINQNKYEKEFCAFKNYICKNKDFFVKTEDKIVKINIDIVYEKNG